MTKIMESRVLVVDFSLDRPSCRQFLLHRQLSIGFQLSKCKLFFNVLMCCGGVPGGSAIPLPARAPPTCSTPHRVVCVCPNVSFMSPEKASDDQWFSLSFFFLSPTPMQYVFQSGGCRHRKSFTRGLPYSRCTLIFAHFREFHNETNN